jgi:DNA modification methylase
MSEIDDNTIDLVVTSPPYPMIQMWDDLFSQADPSIAAALSELDGAKAFEHMHRLLDPVWAEIFRILKPGGIACVNIGDATRTVGDQFQLFSNHARVITSLLTLSFSQLPTIIWRKPTNAPNKFMGSGMLPPGAYVTLEHEYILIFRKGAKREFNADDKQCRRESAFFWEERNAWFSDVWFDLRGTGQVLQGSDRRSGAFPLELPFRLISMFSIQGDTVVDPFLGSGTTMMAAMCTARNSIGYDLDEEMQAPILEKIAEVPTMANQIISNRLSAHKVFVSERMKTKGRLKHLNRPYAFPVMTRQEEELFLCPVQNIKYLSRHRFQIEYGDGRLNSPPSEPKVETLDDDAGTGQEIRFKRRQMKMF